MGKWSGAAIAAAIIGGAWLAAPPILFHQLMVWNGVEVPFEVSVDHLGVSLI